MLKEWINCLDQLLKKVHLLQRLFSKFEINFRLFYKFIRSSLTKIKLKSVNKHEKEGSELSEQYYAKVETKINSKFNLKSPISSKNFKHEVSHFNEEGMLKLLKIKVKFLYTKIMVHFS